MHNIHKLGKDDYYDPNSKRLSVYYFRPFATMMGHFDKMEYYVQYTGNNNKVVKEKSITNVTRTNNNLITRTDTYHYKNNIKRSYIKEISGKPTTANYYYSRGAITWYTYNVAQQLTYKQSSYTKNNIDYKNTESRVYHKNGKVQKIQKMYYKNDKKVKAHKTYYSKEGVVTSKKERKYSKEKVYQQTYIKYSKGKKKYMNIVKFNKRVKAYKATRTTYNNKGKKIKSYRIKITRAITKW